MISDIEDEVSHSAADSVADTSLFSAGSEVSTSVQPQINALANNKEQSFNSYFNVFTAPKQA